MDGKIAQSAPRTKIEWMLCQDQMRALLMEYMDLVDIIKLGEVSRSLNIAINRESNWRFLYRSFYNYSWKKMFRYCYDEYYRCNYSYMLNGNYFICAVSPVYKYTRCVNCHIAWHMCRYCAERDIQHRSMCELCDEWRGLCIRCASIPRLPYDTPDPVFITCYDCDKMYCRDHFSELPGCGHWICDNCTDRVDFIYLGSEVPSDDISSDGDASPDVFDDASSNDENERCRARVHIIPHRKSSSRLQDLYDHEDRTIYADSVDQLPV